jgi:hypothetical protein
MKHLIDVIGIERQVSMTCACSNPSSPVRQYTMSIISMLLIAVNVVEVKMSRCARIPCRLPYGHLEYAEIVSIALLHAPLPSRPLPNSPPPCRKLGIILLQVHPIPSVDIV